MPIIRLTEEQFSFADEYAERFRQAVDYMVDRNPEDQFDNILSCWAIALGTLAYDVYKSIILLLRNGQDRTAWMLARSSVEYHVRLRYYIKQAADPWERWKSSNRKSPLNGLRQTKAYQDWDNAFDKSHAILRNRPLDLSRFPDDVRSQFIQLLEGEKTTLSQNTKHMMDAVFDNETVRLDLYAAHLFRSAYLHGDQIIIIDVIEGKDGKVVVPWGTSGASPLHTFTEVFYCMQEMLVSMKMLAGWVLWHQASQERFLELAAPVFEEVFGTEKPKWVVYSRDST